MSKKITTTTFKTPLLNDCTNHIAFQLKQTHLDQKISQQRIDSLYETPVGDIVTNEFIKGYN